MTPLREARADFDRRYLEKAIRIAKTPRKAAELAGVNRTSFYRLCKRYGVDFGTWRPNKGLWHQFGL